MSRFILSAILVVSWGTNALAQPTIDGSARDPLYGAAVATQDTGTGFGDSTLGRPDWANGSELDNAYAVIYDGYLYLVLSGNLESNGNTVDIFLDTIPEQGQNTLVGPANPDIDFRALHRMGFSDGTEPDPIGTNGPGLTFTSGFAPDFYLTIRVLGDPTAVHVNYAELYVDEQSPGVGYYLGEGRTVCETNGGVLENADPMCPFSVLCTVDNRNVEGVPGGFDVVYDPVFVQSGIELAIPLTAIGDPVGSVAIVAFLNSAGHDWVSNQVLGGIEGGWGDNLGEPRYVNLGDFTASHTPFVASVLTDGVGACCAGSTCSISTESACAGTYLGDNTDCDGNPCDAVPAGRCCVDDGLSGSCEITTEATCTGVGGAYGGDGTDCAGCPCLLGVPGACCLNEECEYLREEECIGSNGAYLGAYRECWEGACVPAACCFDHDCQVLPWHACVDSGGRYLASEPTCDAQPCAQTIWTPYVAGDMNYWEPAIDPMYIVTNGVYEIQFFGLEPLARFEFKITDGTWENSLPEQNSWCYADDIGEVVITYDANVYDDGWAPAWDRIGVSPDPGNWIAVGDWQGWDNNSLETGMSLVEPGLYEYVASGLTPGPHAWKAVVASTWDAISWNARSIAALDMAFETRSPTDMVTFAVNALKGIVRVDVLHDCNSNLVDDAEDLANCFGSAWCSDCNQDFVIDVCDIAAGTSGDVNLDGTPDECESIGACCLGGLCFVIREDLCAGAGGTYLGHGVSCANRPCGAPCDQPDVDGVLDAWYGEPIALQNTRTQYGDNDLGLSDFANGSELDAVYAYAASNERLYIFLAGNLESNFNKLELFFDTRSGGQNRLRGDNPYVDYDGLNRMGDDGSGNGLTFDADFAADFWLGVTGGNDPYEFYANYAELYVDTQHPGIGHELGLGRAANATHGGLLFGDNPDVILATIDNSNTSGVPGGPDLIDGNDHPETVATGVEISIPFSAIGSPTSSFKLAVFVNGIGHDWVSNQVLAGVGGGDNLQEPRSVDFNVVAGNQFVVVPLPPHSDCNSNSVTDVCDLIGGTSTDCQPNGTPDDCDVAAGTSFDCQPNNIPDECDVIADGDFNGDGALDLADYQALADCLAGPQAWPDPAEPSCAWACLAAFDTDPTDSDIDLQDFAAFQIQFYTPPICGNGTVEGDEDCDDSGESATCDTDCTYAECGDGTLNTTAGESCDDGGETATCDIDCTFVECGDGVLNVTAGEECDDGGESATCDADCTFVECGDGVLNVTAGEECDDGGESASCDTDCTIAECGDGTLNIAAGEQCDDGGESASCDTDCTIAECGDGTLNVTAGEECDDANTNGGDGCDANCLLELPPDCLLTFDSPQPCPNTVEVCDALFVGGYGCLDQVLCAEANGYYLDDSTPLTIIMSTGVNKLTVSFAGFLFITGEMRFYDEVGVQVDQPLTTNAECAFEAPTPQTVTFSRPVYTIEVIAVGAGGFVWIDNLWINPP